MSQENDSIIPKSEGKCVEFKRDFSNLKNILKTCVAFANTAGGSIFVGIEDSGKTRGLDKEEIEKQLESFTNTIAQAIKPFILPNLVVRNINNLSILEIQVARGPSKPYYLQSEGSSNGIYIRAGRSSIRPEPEDLQELLLLQSFTKPFDQSIPSRDAALKDLDPHLLDSIYKGYSAKDLVREGILTEDIDGTLFPTLAALVTFGVEPQTYLPERGVRVTKFRGIGGREIVISHDLSGNLSKLAHSSINLIQELTSPGYSLEDKTHLKPQTLFPDIALRELVINALIHRKYNIIDAVKIAIYDDRVEIFSPGDLPPAITLASLGDGTSQVRNVYITKFARKLHLVEKLGSGIRTAKEALAKEGLSPPQFIEQATSFKVILKRERLRKAPELATRKNVAVDHEKLVDQILEYKSQVTKQDLVRQGIAQRTATSLLTRLTKAGKLVRIGKGKATRYILKK